MDTGGMREERRGGGSGSLDGVRRQLRTLPNQLTAARLALVPVLWGVALLGQPVWLGLGVMAASITDMLDGWLSRRWNQTSEFGARLDSVADHLLAISTTLWLVLLRPFFFREQRWPLILWGAFSLLVLLVSWLKFRRFVNLHLYTSKVAVILAFLFGVPLLVLGRYNHVHFWVTLVVCTLAAVESLIVILTRDRVDENIGSILIKGKR